MYSKHHALCSIPVGAAAIALLPAVTVAGVDLPPAALLVYAVAVGVLIDLDHFLIARIRTGTWDAARFCLRNPLVAVADQARIFDRGDVGTLDRLLTHHLIGGTGVAALALASLPLAVLTGVVLYAHLVCDLVWDVWRLDRQAEQLAAETIETES